MPADMRRSQSRRPYPQMEVQHQRYRSTAPEIEGPQSLAYYQQVTIERLQQVLDYNADVINDLRLQLRHSQRSQFRQYHHIEELQECVDHLKMQISTLSDKKDELADNVIADKFEEIFYSVQHFALRHYHGATLKLNDDAQRTLLRFAPGPRHGQSPHWLATSIISQNIIDAMVASCSFRVNTCRPTAAAGILAAGFDGRGDIRTRKWLAHTRSLLECYNKDELQDCDDALVWKTCKDMRYCLLPATEVDLDWKAITKLSKIVKCAVHLWLMVQCQEREYVVEMVSIMSSGRPQHFVPECMTDIASNDDAESDGKRLSMSVFPMIYKPKGPEPDEEAIVVFKAKVLVDLDASSGDTSSAYNAGRAQLDSIGYEIVKTVL